MDQVSIVYVNYPHDFICISGDPEWGPKPEFLTHCIIGSTRDPFNIARLSCLKGHKNN